MESETINDRGRVEEPTKCPDEQCKARFSQRLLHNQCQFNNKQIVKMQVGSHSTEHFAPLISMAAG